MQVKPFRGLRPAADLAAKIPSLPYDVLSSDEARQLARNDEHSFLHVIKPEIDLDPSIDPYDDRVYDKGRENLHGMIDKGWLVRDDAPAFYIYRLAKDDHEQTGIVGAAAIDDYIEDRIKKHELTRPEKEKDRTRHIDRLSVSAGPVFLTYRGAPELNALVKGLTASAPDVDFTSSDQVRHRLWVVSDPSATAGISRLFRGIPASYVADGHHRAASAVNVARLRRARLEHPTGLEPCHYFLAVHFPAEQVRILGYHRLVRDLNGLAPQDFLERVRGAGFEIRTKPRRWPPPLPETFSMYLEGRWQLLIAGPAIVDTARDPASRLDVAILSEHLLKPILGIEDPRTDRRIDFVGGVRGLEELERRVDSGEHSVAFALYPTSIEQVLAVADAGKVMPPKSTWFEPKLRSGMVIQSLDGETL